MCVCVMCFPGVCGVWGVGRMWGAGVGRSGTSTGIWYLVCMPDIPWGCGCEYWLMWLWLWLGHAVAVVVVVAGPPIPAPCQ
jgi:hypothetical protein